MYIVIWHWDHTLNSCISSLVLCKGIDFENQYACTITKLCIRRTFRKTIARYWEWEDGNWQIYTMYHIANKFFINPPRFCNSTRLSVKKTMKNFIEAAIFNWKSKGGRFTVARVLMICHLNSNVCNFRGDLIFQWPSTKLKDLRCKCVG